MKVNKEEIKKYYDRDEYTAIYKKPKKKWILKFNILNKIINIKKGQSLLDVGCSSKMFKPYVDRKNANYFSMDITDKFEPDYVANAENMTILGHKRFDWILCSDVLEHVNDPLKVLMESHEHCEYIAVVVPNLYRLESIPHLPRKKGDRHLTKQSPWKWMGLLKQAGFEIIETRGFYYVPSIAFYPVPPLTWIDLLFRNPVSELISAPFDRFLANRVVFKYLGQEFIIIAKAKKLFYE